MPPAAPGDASSANALGFGGSKLALWCAAVSRRVALEVRDGRVSSSFSILLCNSIAFNKLYLLCNVLREFETFEIYKNHQFCNFGQF